MKKMKLIAPLFGLASVASIAIPLVSCGNGEQKVKNIKVRLDPVSHNVKMTVNGQKPGEFAPNQDLEIALTSTITYPIVTNQIQIYVKKSLIPSNWYEVIESNDGQSAIVKLDKQDVFDDITVYAYAGGVYEETYTSTNQMPYSNWEDYQVHSGDMPSNRTVAYVENSEHMDPQMMLGKDMIYLFNYGLNPLTGFRTKKIICAVGDIVKNRSADYPYTISLSLNIFNLQTDDLVLQLKLDNFPLAIGYHSKYGSICLFYALDYAISTKNLNWSFIFSFDFTKFGGVKSFGLWSISSETDKAKAWATIGDMYDKESATPFWIIKETIDNSTTPVHYYSLY